MVRSVCRWSDIASLATRPAPVPQQQLLETDEVDMPAPKDREKALEAALSQIDRQFGKGSIMRLGDDGRARRFPGSACALMTTSGTKVSTGK